MRCLSKKKIIIIIKTNPLKYWHQSTGLGMGNDRTKRPASIENPAVISDSQFSVVSFSVHLQFIFFCIQWGIWRVAERGEGGG